MGRLRLTIRSFLLFLFIAGVSFPYSVAKQRAGGMSEGRIYAKIVRRGLTLVVLGMVYNGLFKLDFENLRIASVLGRIGLRGASPRCCISISA